MTSPRHDQGRRRLRLLGRRAETFLPPFPLSPLLSIPSPLWPSERMLVPRQKGSAPWRSVINVRQRRQQACSESREPRRSRQNRTEVAQSCSDWSHYDSCDAYASQDIPHATNTTIQTNHPDWRNLPRWPTAACQACLADASQVRPHSTCFWSVGRLPTAMNKRPLTFFLVPLPCRFQGPIWTARGP